MLPSRATFTTSASAGTVTGPPSPSSGYPDCVSTCPLALTRNAPSRVYMGPFGPCTTKNWSGSDRARSNGLRVSCDGPGRKSVYDDTSRVPDYDSQVKTENTRVTYPVDFIDNAINRYAVGDRTTSLKFEVMGTITPAIDVAIS
mgnify:CR=1 FL=1